MKPKFEHCVLGLRWRKSEDAEAAWLAHSALGEMEINEAQDGTFTLWICGEDVGQSNVELGGLPNIEAARKLGQDRHVERLRDFFDEAAFAIEGD